jgi:LPXTG-site transpeptidase (sortase) family protein
MPRAVLLLVIALVVGACTSSVVTEPTPEASSTTTSTTAPTTTTTSIPSSRSPLAEQVVPLGSALFDPDDVSPTPTPPVSVTIDGIGVDGAPVIPVGVEANGEMEIPGATEVGWYQFGPTPRDEGSSVLAAHIAYNGRDGVFRRLASVDLGTIVTVTYADGSTTRHVVTEIAQYGKEDLPFERVFSKTGPGTLTLITCGGDFNRSLNAYDDNIVVYADPVKSSN